MPSLNREQLDAAPSRLPGWLFLLTGMIIVGATVLMPTRLDLVRLKDEVSRMDHQAGRMGSRESAYRQFHLALRTDDPILLRWLAYYHLRLKPAGSNAIDHPGSAIPTVESLVALPQTPAPTQRAKRSTSRLVRLTCGPQRYGMFAVGLLCVVAGLMMPIDRSGRKR